MGTIGISIPPMSLVVRDLDIVRDTNANERAWNLLQFFFFFFFNKLCFNYKQINETDLPLR